MKNLKFLVLFFFIGMTLASSRVNASCTFLLNPETNSFECISEDGANLTDKLDAEAMKKGELPLEHKNCTEGRRSLSIGEDGVYDYGCVI